MYRNIYTVPRFPQDPTVNFAPRGPNESDPPDLLKFRVTPGAILILRQKRKLIIVTPQITTFSRRSLRFSQSGRIRPRRW